MGYVGVAAAVAVVVAILLGLKPLLHGWVTGLRQEELYAVYKLSIISIVLLPVLPNQGFGPWETLNPYEIWWMVVLIAGVSFIGYFAIRIAGGGRGVLLAALLAGLVSSTALTLNFSRLARANPQGQALLAAGIAFALATMFLRLLFIVGIVFPPLALDLLLPLNLMSVSMYGGGYWLWRHSRAQTTPRIRVDTPCNLGMAIRFGGLLAFVMLASRALKEWLGEFGLYFIAGLSGVSDVDATSLSLARLVRDNEEMIPTATAGIFLAAMVNTLVKGGLAWSIGGSQLGLPVLGVLAIALIIGGGSFLI